MTTRSTHDTVLPTRLLQVQTIAASALNTGDVDTRAFDSLQVMVDFGDIDELGTSPVGGAQIETKVEHAADDGTGSAGAYAAVASADIDGLTVTSGGVVSTVTTDASLVRFGYLGSKRFIKVTLTPTGLTNGGPVGVWGLKAHAHLGPVS